MAATAVLVAPAAYADGWADGWGGSVAVASDKVFRGVSQSDGRAALLLDLSRHTDTGWATGVGLAGPGPRALGDTAELTLTFGRSWQLGADWTTQLGVAHYAYLGAPRRPISSYGYGYGYGYSDDYDEFNASAGWQGRLLASVALSPNTSGASATGMRRTDRAVAWELTLHQRLVGRLALDAGIGHYDLRAIRGTGYGYGSVGVNWGFGPVQAYLTWIGSRAEARGVAPASLAGTRWVATLLWSF